MIKLFLTILFIHSFICNICIGEILPTQSNFTVKIEKINDVDQGNYQDLNIIFEGTTADIRSFIITIGFDGSTLSFSQAIEGNIFNDYGWEYFTYEYLFNPNDNSYWRFVRVTGIAEYDLVEPSPNSFIIKDKDIFTTIRFLITNDRAKECLFTPINFFWFDSFDNTFGSQFNNMFLSNDVVYYVNKRKFDAADETIGYPTFKGVQQQYIYDFEDSSKTHRLVNFQGGGFHIACADLIDGYGDMNLNGIPFELEDIKIFINYLVYGELVFDMNVERQIPTTDINKDHTPLTLNDFILAIRHLTGDVPDRLIGEKVKMEISNNNGVVSVSDEIGAAYFIVEGNATPEMLVDNSEMHYNYDGINTNIIIFNLFKDLTFKGDIVRVNGEIISQKFVTYDGRTVKHGLSDNIIKNIRNYPNPFNPKTTISFDMTKSGLYKLIIFNLSGQKINEYQSYQTAGTVNIEWDASNMASGIYFYKLNANNFTETKKMLLLK